MEKYEQYKMLSYLLNALKNRSFFKEHLSEIYDWHDNFGKNIIKFSWLSKTEEEKYIDFKDVLRSQKKQALDTGRKFIEVLEKRVCSLSTSPCSILEKRLKYLAELLNLSEVEQKIFGFWARVKMDDNFDEFNRNIGGRNNKLKTTASFFVTENQHVIEELSDKKSTLFSLGLIENEYNGDVNISDLSIKILSQNIKAAQDIKNIVLGAKNIANLSWKDFSHIEEKDFCARILHKAVHLKEKGVNLLLYGAPGTGKTEFAKTLANKIKTELYSVGENFETDSRKEILNLSYSILSKDNNSCLLVDEADDFLEQDNPFFARKKENNKLYINRLLENNKTPTIWIINSIDNIDKAYLRRFTFAVNFSKPNLKTRTEMWQKSLKAHHLPSEKKIAEEFAIEYKLSPSFIATAVRTAKLADGGLQEVKQSLPSLQKAYNN